MEHNQNTNATINHQRAIESKLMTILDFFNSRWKKLAVVDRLWQLATAGFSGCRREVFKQESMYGLSSGTKKSVVLERWPLVEVRLQLSQIFPYC